MRKSLLGFLGLFLLLIACEKPESKIGLELLPDGENLGFAVDSSTVILHQVFQDSLRTDRLTFALLGDFTDPGIDHATAKIYTQLRLSNPNASFGDSATIDSLILTLDYSGESYGELDEFQVSVKRITDTLSFDSTYFSYDELAVEEVELVDPSRNIITPMPGEDVVVGGDTIAPHMRIKLKNDWGTENLLLADIVNLENSENFIDYMHGLKISLTSVGGNGGMVYLNLASNSNLSKMTMYYHLQDEDSLSYDFDINNLSQQFVQFEHDYMIGGIEDGNPEDDEVIIQSTAGLGVKVTLPNIHDFAEEENIIINRAVLELPVVDDADLESYPPNAEIKAVMTIDGIELNIPDAILSGSGIDYVGGVYDSENKIYKVTVTRFVQQVLNGQIEEPIFTVYPTLSRTVANRTRIKVGTLDEDRRTKLIINYTTF